MKHGKRPIKNIMPSPLRILFLFFFYWLSFAPFLVASNPVVQAAPLNGQVQVFYVTDRKRTKENAPTAIYGDERGKLHFGRCSVRFRPIPGISSLAEYIPLAELNEWEKLEAVQEMEQKEFYAALAASSANKKNGLNSIRQQLVFVHGYNFSFAKACRRAAAIQKHLGPSFEIILYSWPSDSKLLNYTRDLADMDWSVPHLRDFLSRLKRQRGAGKVHLFSHSMGNRGIFHALSQLSCAVEQTAPFGQWIMAAPDLDSDRFESALPQLRTLTGRITRYVSNNDSPLKLSKQLHGYPRLGQAGEDLRLFEGIETIDVSGTSLYEITGHRYYRYNPLVLDDLRQLLLLDWPARRRARLQKETLEKKTYWRLTP